jgi:tRNA 2-thiouridine synthesizing protein A
VNTHVVDARGLLCPLPVIRAQDATAVLACGDTLQVMCTDPGAMHDIPAWCRVNGHRIHEILDSRGLIVITIEVGDATSERPA